MRKYPPFKPSGLNPGSLYRVIRPFTSDNTTFEDEEVLQFEAEAFVSHEECDVWHFIVPETKRVKTIVGTGALADPTNWRKFFEEFETGRTAVRRGAKAARRDSALCAV